MFRLIELPERELCNAYDRGFRGYSIRKKTWPPDLAVTITKDQQCYISSNYRNIKGIAGFICAELLENCYGQIEVVDDSFEKFESNFLLAWCDPDLLDTKEEKLALARFVISQLALMNS